MERKVRKGYVKGIFIKPNTHAKIILCLAKVRVSASMKSVIFTV